MSSTKELKLEENLAGAITQLSLALAYGRIESESYQGRYSIPSSTTSEDGKYWGFMPHPASAVLRYLKKAKSLTRKQNPLFLDVGCGTGNILHIANSLEMRVHGIEINKRFARKSLWHDAISVIDALDYDLYDTYDIVYLFRPIKDRELESRLEAKIESHLREGVVYICFLKASNEIDSKPSLFKRVRGYEGMWVKR